MEFEYFEYEFPEQGAGKGVRIATLLAEHGYQSLQRESRELVERYLPSGAGTPPAAGPLMGARTVDILISPTDPAARIVVSERPAADPPKGVAVAVVAMARSQEDAHRSRTAAKLALDTRGTREDNLAAHAVGDTGRARVRRFRQEWVKDLGLASSDSGGEKAPSQGPRPLAAAQALSGLKDAPATFDRPSVLRSRLDKGGDARLAVDPGLLDGLVSEGLVDRSFVLVCRESGQIVGVGKDAAEVKAAMQVSLRCPHCRKPLSDESQDVLYSLTTQGQEIIRDAKWVREAVEGSLRKRNCEAVVLADGPNGRSVDGAAYYQDAVLLFRLKDSAPAEDDVRAFRKTLAQFEESAPGVTVHGVYVTIQPAPSGGAASKTDRQPRYTALELSRLDVDLDRLLEDVKRDNFIRLTGTAMDLVQPDPRTLLAHEPA